MESRADKMLFCMILSVSAGRMATRDALTKGSAKLMEPMMKVEVVTPEEYMGDVIGDINSRRGMVQVCSAELEKSLCTGFLGYLRWGGDPATHLAALICVEGIPGQWAGRNEPVVPSAAVRLGGGVGRPYRHPAFRPAKVPPGSPAHRNETAVRQGGTHRTRCTHKAVHTKGTKSAYSHRRSYVRGLRGRFCFFKRHMGWGVYGNEPAVRPTRPAGPPPGGSAGRDRH